MFVYFFGLERKAYHYMENILWKHEFQHFKSTPHLCKETLILRCEILGSSAHPRWTSAKGGLEISILRGLPPFLVGIPESCLVGLQRKYLSQSEWKNLIHKLTNWSPSLNQVAMNYSATNSISATNNMVILLILSYTQAKVLAWLTTRVIVLLHGFHHMFGSRQDAGTRVKNHMAGRCGTWATQVLKLVGSKVLGSNSLKLVGSSNSNYI